MLFIPFQKPMIWLLVVGSYFSISLSQSMHHRPPDPLFRVASSVYYPAGSIDTRGPLGLESDRVRSVEALCQRLWPTGDNLLVVHLQEEVLIGRLGAGESISLTDRIIGSSGVLLLVYRQ